MPTIKTIQPAGGGDFTSLVAWEDWADDQLTADQWAECYEGGNLGGVMLLDWISTPTATVHPRIYGAEGQRHQGTLDAGCFTTTTLLIGVDHVELDGLRFTDNPPIWGASDLFGTIQNCLYNTSSGQTLYAGAGVTQTTRNCLFVAGSGILSLAASGGLIEVFNCTLFSNGFACLDTSGTTSGTVRIVNTIAMNGSIKDFNLSGAGVTFDVHYCLSSDATAADKGGAGHILEQSADAVLADWMADDFSLKSDSPALDAGANLTADGLVTDIRGTQRPQGSGFDMGAFELEVAASGSGHWSQLSRRGRFGPMGRVAP